MSPINSRRKGKSRELEVVKILAETYPECCRNLDQFGMQKMDVLNVGDLHIQVKGVEKLNIWNALDQTITEAQGTDLPVLAFRRNFTASRLPSRSLWFAALELTELIALLRLREAM